MVRGASLIAAAAAELMLDVDDAWAVHHAVEARYDFPPLMPVEPEYQEAFTGAISALRKRRDQLGSPPWPRLLTCDVDKILRAAMRRREAELG